MVFRIRMGLLEMAAYWNDISPRKLTGKLDKDEAQFLRNWSRRSDFSARIRVIRGWHRMRWTT